jgi:hypothetical protein
MSADDTSVFGMATPDFQRGDVVTNALRQMSAFDQTNDNREILPRRSKYLKFTPDQLSQFITACSGQLIQQTPTSVVQPTVVGTSSATTNPAYFNNAKYEDICCRPIKPLYDGSEADLMPFLLGLDIRRQDEGWAPATYISIDDRIFDLTYEFAYVTELDVSALAKQRWTATTVNTDKHTVGHDTCHARLLAKCLMASIPSDLILTILNRLLPKYRNDGTYVLWAIANNIYCNNVAFVENIREKIYTAMLAHHNNDIEKYLVYVKNNLRMITSPTTSKRSHNGLITYILRQLKFTTNAPFLRYIQDLHVDYQEGKLPKCTPLKLIQAVEDKIRVLKHAEVWDSAGTSETPAMALASNIQFPDQLKEFLANHISAKLKKLQDTGKDSGKDSKGRQRFQHQDWMFIGPANPAELKTVNGRNYNWRTKCGRGNGQWVQSHTTDTHQDSFRLPSRRSDASKKGLNGKRAYFTAPEGILKNKPPPTAGEAPSTQHNAQLSLADGVTNCFRFDVTSLEGED